MLKFSESILDIIHWNIFRIISFHLGLIEREQQYDIFALFQNIKGGITFFFFSENEGGNYLILKFEDELWTTPNIKWWKVF